MVAGNTTQDFLSSSFDVIMSQNVTSNNTLPPEMVFGQAQIISISVYIPLFICSSILNLKMLRKLLQTKRRSGLSRLNQLLMHLVLADLSVSNEHISILMHKKR